MQKGVFISFLMLAACSGYEEPKAPKDLIPTREMIPLIVDLQVLEAHYERLYVHPAVFKNALDSSSELLFKDYRVTRDQFDRSFSWYALDADTIYAIYEAALDSISFRINQQSFSQTP